MKKIEKSYCGIQLDQAIQNIKLFINLPGLYVICLLLVINLPGLYGIFLLLVITYQACMEYVYFLLLTYGIFTVLPKKMNKNSSKTIAIHSSKNFNTTAFVHDVTNSAIFNSILNFSDVNAAWNAWKTEYLRICDIHAPIIQHRIRNQPNFWLNNEIKSMTYRRDYLHRSGIRSKSETDWNSYKKMCNMVSLTIRNVKKSYYFNQINTSSDNSSAMWKTLKNILPSKKSHADISNLNPDKLNEFFNTIGEQLTKCFEIDVSEEICHLNNQFNFLELNPNNVIKHLLQLPNEAALIYLIWIIIFLELFL